MKKYEYQIRTDLAIQNPILKNTRTYTIDNIIVKRFVKDIFHFTNIIFTNIETKANIISLKELFQKELQKYFKKYKFRQNSAILVVGLGNNNISSDALGTKTISYIKATAHLKSLNLASNMRTIYTFSPGVTSNTGYSAFKSIKALKKELKPDFILIIDSLISDSIIYLNKLIQISDSGIIPGSGVGNYQDEISTSSLGVPVITIGVPTAIEASSIIRDAMNIKENKITFKEGYDLIVSTKDIDITINKISQLIGEAINETLNNALS